jgi:hypothetical protein
MGYTTDFTGHFDCTPTLKSEHITYLVRFSETRRMCRDAKKAAQLPDPIREAAGLPVGPEGCYFVGNLGEFGQGGDASILDYNRPPSGTSTPLERLAAGDRATVENWGQPGLWCSWEPTEDGTQIIWNGSEKFYHYRTWINYWIENFLEPWGYTLNGTVEYQGEDDEDKGKIVIINNQVEKVEE